MDLDTFNQLVDESNAHDWKRVVSNGGTYTDAFYPSKIGASEHISLDVDSHDRKVVLRQDIDISIAWGRDPNGTGSSSSARERVLTFDWAEKFFDSKVYAVEVEIFYRGNLIRREEILSVDGHRGYLPFPHTRRKAGSPEIGVDAEDFYYSVTPEEVKFARLMDQLANRGSRDFDQLLSTAGFEIEEQS